MKMSERFQEVSGKLDMNKNGKLKKNMEQTCQELGMSMTTAITIFAKKMTREKRIPFDVSVDPFYSEENQDHLEKVISNYYHGKTKPIHKNIEELEGMEGMEG